MYYISGVFISEEPLWYIRAYPYFIHPLRGIIQTSAIFMVVAVTTERYRYGPFQLQITASVRDRPLRKTWALLL